MVGVGIGLCSSGCFGLFWLLENMMWCICLLLFRVSRIEVEFRMCLVFRNCVCIFGVSGMILL